MSEKFSREQFAAKLGANGDPKLTAAADFAARLLNGPMGEHIERIMLFGSVAVGETRPNSDVDVMVFGDAPREELRDVVYATAYEGEDEEDIAPIVYAVDDMHRPRSLVVYNTLKYGREIFARHSLPNLSFIDEDKMQIEEARKIYRKALSHFSDGQFASDNGKYAMAIVALYTAAELAVRALILLKPGRRMPSSHKRTIERFGRDYVLTGEAPPLWGRLLNKDFDLRQMALYNEDAEITREEAQEVRQLAHDLLDLLKRKLEETESGNPN